MNDAPSKPLPKPIPKINGHWTSLIVHVLSNPSTWAVVLLAAVLYYNFAQQHDIIHNLNVSTAAQLEVDKQSLIERKTENRMSEEIIQLLKSIEQLNRQRLSRESSGPSLQP